MNTADFDYRLPTELIAQHPAARRDGARMMVLHRADQRIEHRRFRELPEFLRAGDLLVLNNTRVIPARLYARKPETGGRAELFLLEEVAPGEWDILMRCRRRPDPGQHLLLDGGQGRAVILSYGEEGRARVRFETTVPFAQFVEAHGHTPLPPYIKREGGEPQASGEDASSVAAQEAQITDAERYQTIYARHPGAVAAPTAGLHFTPDVFQTLAARGVERTEITLHVGLGTFRPVSAARVEDHRMHDERYEVPAAAAEAINRARRDGGRIVAVGSTSVRTLESVADEEGRVHPGSGRTDKFIYPPYTFRAVDVMLTNFHLPQSTLLMMVCALAGTEVVLRAYDEAVRERYRFFSYGDCMLIT